MDISLAEQLLLLSYDEVSGKPAIPMGNLDYGLSGAHLLDLVNQGALAIDGDKLVVTAAGGDDPAVARIRADKPHSPDYWVYHLATPQRRKDLLDRMVAAGLLDKRDHRILGLFHRPAYPEVDPTEEQAMIEHLRQVLSGDVEPDHRSVSLLTLAHACGLDQHLFPGMDRKAMRQRLQELSQGEWCGPAVRKTIGAMDAAVLAAVSGGAVAPTAGAVAAT